ncbi:hypothetical protein DFJ58DRAFT_432547 [Suillus subalutaceus]|uniref:uncharacterized protein n=1 Tax=Suillus subalutaceus TaxID=48586 RepID=UPI001B87C4A2|nr:uncharacterized protein DFJ58DRAFT_432547 [Suillus subalutaceus]KAG1850585.1 hypothetical protein DFJ58DRAFT_432547 [Suillus subalutaceus]
MKSRQGSNTIIFWTIELLWTRRIDVLYVRPCEGAKGKTYYVYNICRRLRPPRHALLLRSVSSFRPPRHAVLLRVRSVSFLRLFPRGLTTMATSASFHDVVGLQNGSTPEIGDIRVNVFTFRANTSSAEDGIYRNAIRRNCIRRIGRFSAGRSYCQRSRRNSNFGSISEIIDAMARHVDFESQHRNSQHG